MFTPHVQRSAKGFLLAFFITIIIGVVNIIQIITIDITPHDAYVSWLSLAPAPITIWWLWTTYKPNWRWTTVAITGVAIDIVWWAGFKLPEFYTPAMAFIILFILVEAAILTLLSLVRKSQ